MHFQRLFAAFGYQFPGELRRRLLRLTGKPVGTEEKLDAGANGKLQKILARSVAWLGRYRQHVQPEQGFFVFWQRGALVSLAGVDDAQGLGLACLPTWLVAEDLQAGRLEAVLTDYRMPEATILGVYAHRRQLAPKVRTFLDYIADRLRPEE